jgi:hypothetical protein
MFKPQYTSAVSMDKIYSIVHDTQRKEKSLAELNRIDPERTSTGTPECYAIVEQNKYTGRIKYQLWPIADSQGHSLRIYYKKLVADMSADAAIPLCSPQLLEAWALEDCYRIAAIDNPVYLQLARDQHMLVREHLHEEVQIDLQHTSLPDSVRDVMEGPYINDDYRLDHDTEPW